MDRSEARIAVQLRADQHFLSRILRVPTAIPMVLVVPFPIAFQHHQLVVPVAARRIRHPLARCLAMILGAPRRRVNRCLALRVHSRLGGGEGVGATAVLVATDMDSNARLLPID